MDILIFSDLNRNTFSSFHMDVVALSYLTLLYITPCGFFHKEMFNFNECFILYRLNETALILSFAIVMHYGFQFLCVKSSLYLWNKFDFTWYISFFMCLLVSFSLFWQNAWENELKKGNVYLGPWLQIIVGSFALRSVQTRNTMTREHNKAKLLSHLMIAKKRRETR